MDFLTWRTQLEFKAKKNHLLECVVNDLVDAEVSHPEDNRAGHELSLVGLGWRGIE